MSLTAALYLLGFAAGVTLALFRHPIYGLVTYVAMVYLDAPSRWWAGGLPDLRWSLLAAGATAIGLLVRRGRLHGPSLFRQSMMRAQILFLVWLAIQSLWALNWPMHRELLILWMKFIIVIGLIYWSIESAAHLRLFIVAHVAGCWYLGVLAFMEYAGGRFEGFGGGGIGEANVAALLMVTGILSAVSLLFVGRLREKFSATAAMPFMVNALVTTISRSGFLAAIAGGAIYNLFSPGRSRTRVGLLSVLGVALFFMLTGPAYWNRIDTLKYAGEHVQGVDTGGGRLDLIRGQWQMFLDHPLGCGHRCTADLSPMYFDAKDLAHADGVSARSSHNTFMSLLVEQGVPGALFYSAFLYWLFRVLRRLARSPATRTSNIAFMVPAVASVLVAIAVGDLFVDYLKLEVRIWFIGLLLVMIRMIEAQTEPLPQPKWVKDVANSSDRPTSSI